MDPDKVLHELRELVAEATSESGAPRSDLASDIGDKFEALDGWLSSGGFLPGAWREGGEDHR